MTFVCNFKFHCGMKYLFLEHSVRHNMAKHSLNYHLDVCVTCGDLCVNTKCKYLQLCVYKCKGEYLNCIPGCDSVFQMALGDPALIQHQVPCPPPPAPPITLIHWTSYPSPSHLHLLMRALHLLPRGPCHLLKSQPGLLRDPRHPL